MAEYKERQQDLRLYNVRTITSLEQINDISENVLNSSYAVFAYDNDRTKRYVSHKVKFSDIMDEAFKRSWTYIDVLRDELDYFLRNLDLRFNKTYLNIVKEPIDNGFHDWHNQRLSYFFTINPIISELIEEPNSYIVSYIPEHIVDGVVIPGEYSYLHSSYLTPGLISYTVLQDYIDNTLERLMGVPMTKEQQDLAINSLQEFVNWFTNYTYTDEEYGNLQRLINTMDRKDETVHELSYAYTDLARELSYAYTASERDKLSTSINNTFNGLNFTYSCEEHRFLTGIKQVNGKIVEVTDDEGGLNIEVDQNNNTITVSGTQYTLSMTNGKLGLYPYTELAITSSSGGGSLERGTTASSTNLSFSITTNKAFGTVTWYNGTNTSGNIASETATTSNSGKTSTIIVSQNGNNTVSRTCKVTENDTSITKTKTISLSFDSYGVFYFGTSTVITSDIFNVNNGTLSATNVTLKDIKKPTLLKNSGGAISSSITTTLNFGNENLYVYLLIPQSRINTNFKFWMGGDLPEDENLILNNIKLYDNNIVYNLYKSLNLQTGTVSVKYGAQS